VQRILRENSLTVVMFVLFVLSLAGQSAAGYAEFNDDRQQHGQTAVRFNEYLASGHFVEAVFENWESEFLQMAIFVWLTAFLRQKGSPESKKLEGKEDVDADPRAERE
jgi:hypothetical protein